LKYITSQVEACSHSIVDTRIFTRDGINFEQLTRDLKSFEIKDKILMTTEISSLFLIEMKRYIGSYKETQCFSVIYMLEDYINRKSW